jgi:hypothetical protein
MSSPALFLGTIRRFGRGEFSSSAVSVKSITHIALEPDVHIEVSVISTIA